MATFHPFPRLPAKLRIRIWELTVEPRIVEVRVLNDPPLGWPPIRRILRSSTPAPAQLQTCREARDHLTKCPDSAYRFENAFSELTATSHNQPVSEGDPQEKEEERYVWFNFDKDMLSVGKTDLHQFLAVADRIHRLRLQRELWDEYFARCESDLITRRWRGRRFRNLTEIHLMDPWGIRSGYLMAEEIDFPCGPENVYFGDPESGEIMNSIDLDAMVAREHEELERLEEQS